MSAHKSVCITSFFHGAQQQRNSFICYFYIFLGHHPSLDKEFELNVAVLLFKHSPSPYHNTVEQLLVIQTAVLYAA